MSAPAQGLVVIHGHFYQPPRENPWTGEVDAEPSAAPDHDWNVRITRETYEPLVAVEIEDGGKKVKVPVYEYLSFDFGPTLLDWMEREAREIHDVVIRASPRRGLRSPCSHRIRSRVCPNAAALRRSRSTVAGRSRCSPTTAVCRTTSPSVPC